MRIFIAGAGSWGTTIAKLLAEKGNRVFLWCYEKSVADEINRLGENRTYLPGVKLPEIEAVTDFSVLLKADLLINAVPVQFIEQTWRAAVPLLRGSSASLINLSKGIEVKRKRLVHQIFFDLFGERISYAVLSGPSFAKEVAERKPTAVTVSAFETELAVSARDLFATSYFRVYSHDDVVGTEAASAVKNVIAIAAGICVGLGLGSNALSSLITRGLAEMTRFGCALGAKAHTFFGLAGVGDLVLTCTGDLSRNRRVGVEIGRGKSLKEAVRSLGGAVAEGVETVKAVVSLAGEKSVEMPISFEVHRVLFEGKSPKESLSHLMERKQKFEFYWFEQA